MDEKTPDKDRPHRAPERSSSRRRWDEVDPSERPSKHSSRDRSETEKTRSREGKSRPHEESGYDRRRERERERSVERSGREVRRRSRSPERRKDFDEFESDNDRSGKLKGKEGYREERGSKGKEDGWSDRSREREKDQRKRRDHRDGDTEYEYEKDWDSKRREPDWMDGDKSQGRGSYRKGGRSRGDGMRSGSGFSTSNEHSDTIEIKPNKKLDFCRDVPAQVYPGRKAEGGPQPEMSPSGRNDEDSGYQVEDRGKSTYGYGDEFPEKYPDDGSPRERRSSLDGSSGKPRGQKIPTNVSGSGAGQTCSGGSSALFGNNQGLGSHNRAIQQGPKGGRHTRGVRGRPTGRDSPRVMMPMAMIAPPTFPLTMPPGPMPPMGPNIPPSPGPPVGPNVFMPPFPGHLMWPGARMDMTMLGVPPSLPPGLVGPRFPPNVGTGPNHAMYFNQSGPGRGVSPNVPGPGFSPMGSAGRGMPHDKVPAGWTPQRSSGPAGKAPSRGEQNDYSQNFVDTGMRPQNFIRELELTSTVEDYPKLRELIQKKDEIVVNSASAPMYYKCDLREHVLSPEFFGTKFDVILVDPPWEEYVHRAPGVADHMEYWTFEEILNLKIEAIADTPSFIFLWVGDGVGLEQGRQCLKKWGFRRCEDICWVKTNKTNATPSLRHDSHTLFQHTKEHCLMGIKGTVRRSTDGHIIHANIDTDIIIAEEPAYGSTTKPEDIYRIIEHFSLGRRRLELFGEDHNIRAGWITLGKCLSSSNFNSEAFCRNFSDKDGKVWQGGGGRNPPPDAPHLVLTTPDIESLRPKSPPQKNQQQPQPASLSNTANSSKRPAANSPQNPMATPMHIMNQEVSSSNPPGPVPWASSPMLGGFRGLDPSNAGPDDKFPDGYGFNPSRVQMGADHPEFDPNRGANLL